MKKIFISAFLILSFAAAVFAQGDVYLSLSATGSRSDIAIQSFGNSDGLAESAGTAGTLKDVVQNDLILSRYFNVILGDPDPQLPFQQQLEMWDKKGASVLLGANVVKSGNGGFIVEAKMYDVASGQVIWKQSYLGKNTEYRLVAHNISDEIVRRFTGEFGIANTKIVFANDSTGKKEIYIIDYDGYNLRRLTKDGKINILPKWAPDGSGIIYTSYIYNNPDLMFLNLGTNTRSVISKFTGLNAAGSFAPDGMRIILTLSRGKAPNLFLISNKGEIIRRLTDGSQIDTSATFAPNGQEIVFISDRPGYPQLYIMSVDGGNIRRLTTAGFCDSPAWSPRGDKIVFTMRQPKGNYDLYVYDLPTAKITQLTSDKRNNENPTWSPDGRFVVFSSNRAGKYELYIMAIDGSGTRKLADMPGTSHTPSWSPNLNK